MNSEKSIKQEKASLKADRTEPREVRSMQRKSKLPLKDREIPREEIKRLRLMGCLQDREVPGTFKVRVITRNGLIPVEEYRALSVAVDRFGSGSVRLSSQLTVDILGVPYEKTSPLIDFLACHGLMTGGTGPELKPVMACNGTNCRFGLIDTLGLEDQLQNRVYSAWRGVSLPHKFKIVVGGCPNNCMQPELSDLGIVGQKIPVVDADNCRFCKKCQPAFACPAGAVKRENDRIYVDTDACIHCGRCLGKCPFSVFEEYKQGYQVLVGGHGGRKMVQARPIGKILSSEEALMNLVEKALLLYQREGIAGERFADTIDRLGFASVENELMPME